jgi:hypothetical protein
MTTEVRGQPPGGSPLRYVYFCGSNEALLHNGPPSPSDKRHFLTPGSPAWQEPTLV